MTTYPPTSVSTPHRLAERVSYDRELVHSILDEALISHLGFDSGGPLVLPLIHARIDERVYLHMSTGSGMGLCAPLDCCLTASIVDDLVMAKSQFHHSLNYRSVVIRGQGEVVTDLEERSTALAAIVDHVSPGRSAASRPWNARELAATRILRLMLEQVSAKVRSGPPKDDEEDLDLPFWSGIVPVTVGTGTPIPSPDSAPEAEPPQSRY